MGNGVKRTRQLEERKAFLAWLGQYPVRHFELSDKFSGDHTLEHLSSSAAAERAVQRFARNGNTCSTWMDITKEKIVDKVRGTINNARYFLFHSAVPENALTLLRPTVYRGSQQLAASIKCSVRTVTVESLTRDEAQHPRHRNRHHTITSGNTTHYLRCRSSEEETKFWIMGAWNPLQEHFTLYHYQGHTPQPEVGMLPEYRRWTIDEDGNPTTPSAKK